MDAQKHAMIYGEAAECRDAMQSHRPERAYFAAKPLTNDKLSKALHHCEKLGIQL